jgi:hypothetical protein
MENLIKASDLELIEILGTKLKEEIVVGKKSYNPIVVHGLSEPKVNEKGEAYFQAYCSQIQISEGKPTNILDELLLGWNNKITRIVRTIRNIKLTEVEKRGLKFEVGSNLENILGIGGLYIKVKHTKVKPNYESAQPVKANIEGKLQVMADEDNDPIYQLTSIEQLNIELENGTIVLFNDYKEEMGNIKNVEMVHERVKLQQFKQESTLSLLEQEAEGMLEK